MRKPTLALTAMTVAGAVALASTSAATASTKSERFTLIATSTTDGPPDYSVVATGAFIDGGTATHEGKGVLLLHLTSGTITLDGTVQHHRITTTETATTCMQTAVTTISYTIAQGTGAYTGISGSGRVTDEDLFVEQLVHGECSPNVAAAQGTLTASGPVSLP